MSVGSFVNLHNNHDDEFSVNMAMFFAMVSKLFNPIVHRLPKQKSIEEITFIENLIKSQNENEIVRRKILKMIYNKTIYLFNRNYEKPELDENKFKFIYKNIIMSYPISSPDNIVNDQYFEKLLDFIICLDENEDIQEIVHIINIDRNFQPSIYITEKSVKICCFWKGALMISASSINDLIIKIKQLQSTGTIFTSPELEIDPREDGEYSLSTITRIYPFIHLQIGENIGIYEITSPNCEKHRIRGKYIHNVELSEITQIFTAKSSDLKSWISYLLNFKLTIDELKHYLFIIDISDGMLETLYDGFVESFDNRL